MSAPGWAGRHLSLQWAGLSLFSGSRYASPHTSEGSQTRKSLGEAWPQLRFRLQKTGQAWFLVAEWTDTGVSLLLYVCTWWWLCVCVRGAQLENILELSHAVVRITVRGGAGLGAGTMQPKSFVSSHTHRIPPPPSHSTQRADWEIGLSVAHLQNNPPGSHLIVISPVRAPEEVPIIPTLSAMSQSPSHGWNLAESTCWVHKALLNPQSPKFHALGSKSGLV